MSAVSGDAYGGDGQCFDRLFAGEAGRMDRIIRAPMVGLYTSPLGY